MIACHCGATLYRGGDGEHHCIRCESRTDLCPACDGYGHRMRGRLMRTCEICGGSGSRSRTDAPMSGNPSAAPMDDSCCGVSDVVEAYGSLAVGRSAIGRQRDCCTTSGGG